MAYAKYFRRNGKVFGPYYYESYRKDGRIYKRYLGTSIPGEKGITAHLLPFIYIFIAVLFVFIMVNYGFIGITGNTLIEEVQEAIADSKAISVEKKVISDIENGDGLSDDQDVKENSGNEKNSGIVGENINREISDKNVSSVGDMNITINESVAESVNNIEDESSGNILNETVDSSENLTISNETINEEIIVNETKGNTSIQIKTARLTGKIRVGVPVKWLKNISLDAPENVTVELPKLAEKVNVKKIEGGMESHVDAKVSLSGKAISEADKKGFFTWIISILKFIGFVVHEEQAEVIEVVLEESVKDYVIEYETPAPSAFEVKTSSGKRVIISGPDELNYTDVIAFAEIEEKFEMGQEENIRVIWKEKGGEIGFDSYDRNNNGLIDEVEWVVPHLSNQTFEIILITKADHLDSNRTFIEDVFDLVKERDSIFAVIPAGDYVRVTFERNLTFDRDITIYAKSSGGSVEVYEENGEDVLALFDSITEDKKYQIFLDNLTGSQDVFDLKVLGQMVEFDFIIDPQANDSLTIYQCGTIDSPGVYTLNQSLSTSGTCLTLKAGNVTIDGGGYNIDGDDSGVSDYGITDTAPVFLSLINVTIKNLNITDFRAGIYLDSTINSKIWNNTLTSNYNGIYLESVLSNNNELINNTANSNTNDGILIEGSTENLIENNTASFNTGVGIRLKTSANRNIIRNNSANSNSNNGIYIVQSDDNNLSYNLVELNTNIGIYFDTYAADNIVDGDKANSNGVGGFSTGLGERISYKNVVANSNPTGISLRGNSTLINSTINGSTTTAITISGDYNNVTNVTLSNLNDIIDFRVSVAGSDSNYLIDMPYIGNYTFVGAGGTIFVKDSDFGEIRFMNAVSGTGTNFSNDVRILNNSIVVEDSSNSGLNKSANISFYGIGDRGANANMLRNGNVCDSTTSPSCHNFTSLTASTVVFNVSAWSNYSIGNDTRNPLITIHNPTGAVDGDDIFIEFSLNEAGSCRYSLDSGLNNFSMLTNNNNITFNSTTVLTNGLKTVYAYCNDTSGNMNNAVNGTFVVGGSSIIEEEGEGANYAFGSAGCSPSNNWCGGLDFDKNGFVDAGDLSLLRNCQNIPNFSPSCSIADLNKDGLIDDADANILKGFGGSGGGILSEEGGGIKEVKAVGCEGDVNKDGIVNFKDSSEVRKYIGFDCGQFDCRGADVNDDGYVDFTDLSVIRGNFGLTCDVVFGKISPDFLGFKNPRFWKSTFAYGIGEFNQKDSIDLSLKKEQRMRLIISGIDHYVGIANVTETTARIIVFSDPQDVTLSIGESAKFDVNDDEIYDFEVSLGGIVDGSALIEIEPISELISLSPSIFAKNVTFKCIPEIKCGEWQGCRFNSKISDAFEDETQKERIDTRECYDSAKCSKNIYVEERTCTQEEDKKTLAFSLKGGEIIGSLPATGKVVVTSSVDDFMSGKLNINFLEENEIDYSPPISSCYNGIMDQNEEGVDCGRDCRDCLTEKGIIITELVNSFEKRWNSILIPKSWIYGLLTFIIISLIALLGINIGVKFKGKKIFNKKIGKPKFSFRKETSDLWLKFKKIKLKSPEIDLEFSKESKFKRKKIKHVKKILHIVKKKKKEDKLRINKKKYGSRKEVEVEYFKMLEKVTKIEELKNELNALPKGLDKDKKIIRKLLNDVNSLYIVEAKMKMLRKKLKSKR